MEDISRKALPPGFDFAWAGQSLEEVKAGSQAIYIFALSLTLVYLVLAAQYEKWSLPLSVLLALPFGTFGALAAIWVNNLLIPIVGSRPLTNDVYFQIGLVTLFGLSAKNAILIVEFAAMQVRNGVDVTEAAIEAARLRFRPILMTSLAFILGVLPLAISGGADSPASPAAPISSTSLCDARQPMTTSPSPAACTAAKYGSARGPREESESSSAAARASGGGAPRALEKTEPGGEASASERAGGGAPAQVKNDQK